MRPARWWLASLHVDLGDWGAWPGLSNIPWAQCWWLPPWERGGHIILTSSTNEPTCHTQTWWGPSPPQCSSHRWLSPPECQTVSSSPQRSPSYWISGRANLNSQAPRASNQFRGSFPCFNSDWSEIITTLKIKSKQKTSSHSLLLNVCSILSIWTRWKFKYFKINVHRKFTNG